MGNERAVDLLLRHSSQVEPRSRFGMTPLHFAAVLGHSAVIKLLLEAGAEVNSVLPPQAAEGAGSTPLHGAVGNSQVAVIRELIAAGADPYRANTEHVTPLMTAILTEDEQALQALIDAGVDVNRPLPPEVGLTLLAGAVRFGRPDTVELLLKNGANPNLAAPGNGTTALHHAAALGDIPVARLLLNHGADIELRDSQGMTPLLFATFCGADDTHEAPRLGRHKAKAPPVDEARQRRIIEFLLKNKATLDAVDHGGHSALHAAALNDNAAAARLLLERGLERDQADGDGEMPIHVAAGCGSISVLKVLLEAGADANSRASFGRRPLDLLAYNADRLGRDKSREAAKVLRKAGATFSIVPDVDYDWVKNPLKDSEAGD
jgi:ankyrin repeat protein